MKVFLDVGGHVGQTVEAALDPAFAFEKIYSFEPVAECCEQIERIRDPRLTVICAGLLDQNTQQYIFAPGTTAASIFSDHQELPNHDKELCRFIEAAGFFDAHLSAADLVYMKLNCEGSECAILENLMTRGWFSHIREILIDFDIRKITSGSGKYEQMMEILNGQEHRNFHFPEEVQYGWVNQFGAIQNWLRTTGAVEKTFSSQLKSYWFHARNIMFRRHMGYYKLLLLKRLPVFVVSFYYSKIKNQARSK